MTSLITLLSRLLSRVRLSVRHRIEGSRTTTTLFANRRRRIRGQWWNRCVRLLCVHLAAGLWCTLLLGGTATAQPLNSNVLLIIIDDLNDFVGVLGGHPQAYSPNIDNLAAQGVSFHNAHVQATLCNPSRVSLLTGIAPARSGVLTNANHKPWRNFLPDAVSLNQAFRQAGYHTVGYGKIYHGNTTSQDTANWDQYHARPSSATPPDAQIPLNGLDQITLGGIGGGDWGRLEVPDNELEDHKVATWAVDFLNARDPADPRPFFLAVGLRSTHSPWYFSSSYYDLVGNENSIALPSVVPDDTDDVGAIARNWAKVSTWAPLTGDPAKVAHGVHSYLAAVAFADAQVGRILSALDSSAFTNDTVVVVISDHGYHLSEKQTWQKNKLWEEDTRVPFIFRLPAAYGVTPAAIQTPVNASALFPTLLDLAGIALPAYSVDDPQYRIDFRSLVPLMENDPTARWAGPAVTSGRGQQISLRTDQYRFTVYENNFVELYDETADPREWSNIASQSQHAALLGEFRTAAERYLSGRHAPLGYEDTCGPPDYDSATDRALFLWQDCDAVDRERWRLRATAGGSGSVQQFAGELTLEQNLLDLMPVDLEAGDVLNSSTDMITFAFAAQNSDEDGFDLDLTSNEACLDLSAVPPGTPLLIGEARFVAASPIRLDTLMSCESTEPLPTGRLGDYVWNDADEDGVQDAGEAGFPQVTANLQLCDGTHVAATTSESDGSYIFESLPSDRYRVVFIAPAGFTFSPQNQTTGGKDSNPNPSTGITGCVNLPDGASRLGIDAGLVAGAASPSASIGDFVWHDTSGDGIQDVNESGLAGVAVNLQTCDGVHLTSTTSDVNGRYLFEKLNAGRYKVHFVLPAGFAFSPPAQTNGGKDSNPDPATGLTSCQTMSEGQARLGIDAGMI